MDPKVAVVCGAHTQLGKFVLRELLRHERIERIYALAERDPRDQLSIRPTEFRKLVLHIETFDQIEKLIADNIPDVDLAFCCLGCGKAHLSSLGALTFHRLNLDIPQRFIHEMFRLGAQHISILSHVAAASHKRPTEFHRVKGELADKVRQLHQQAGQYAPAVSLFNVPQLLTDMQDQNGIRDQHTSKMDKFWQIAAHKFEFKPNRAVHVRDVAKAMVADAFERLEFEDDSEINDIIKQTHVRIAELDGPMIVYLANATRAIQRNTTWKQHDRGLANKRVSNYARQQGAFEDLDKLSDDETFLHQNHPLKPHTQQPYQFDHLQTNLTPHPAITDSNPPVSQATKDLSFDEDSLESSGIERYRSLSHVQELSVGNTIPPQSPSTSQPRPPAPSPVTNNSYHPSPSREASTTTKSARSQQSKTMTRSKSLGSLHSSQNNNKPTSPPSTKSPVRSFYSHRRPRSTTRGYDIRKHVGNSAASLGEQIGRTLTTIHGNNILPDVRHPIHLPSSTRKSNSQSRQPHHLLYGSDGAPLRRLQYDVNHSRSPRTNNHTNSLSSPPSGSLERAAYDVPLSPPRLPDNKKLKHLPLQQLNEKDYMRQSFGSGNSRRKSQSLSSRRSSRKSDTKRSIGLSFSDGKSSNRDSQPGNVISQLSFIAGKVFAVTERPSTRRAREEMEMRRLARLGKEHPDRPNGDMRAIGQTTI